MGDQRKIEDIEFKSDGGDSGIVFTGRCPDCMEEIYGCTTSWSDPIVCQCGLKWELTLELIGTKTE